MSRLFALSIGILLAFLVVEIGFRVREWARGEPYDGARSERHLDEFVEELKGLNFIPADGAREATDGAMLLHPYEGFQAPPAWKRADDPGNYYTGKEGLQTYDILLMGGSVAAGFGRFAHATLVSLLEADPRLSVRPVRIHNRACPAHKQPQLATNLEWAFSLGIQPDAVVLLDGFNELAVAHSNAKRGVHPLFPAWAQMQTALSSPLANPGELEVVGNIFAIRHSAEQLADRARRWGLMHSAVLGSRVEREFDGLTYRSRTLLAEYERLVALRSGELPLFIRGPNFVNEPENVLSMSIRAWMEGSRSMQAACRARGVHFVHVLQPAARDKGSKQLTDKEEQVSFEPKDWREVIEAGYPRLREAGVQLVGEGVNFHDGSRVFADHPEEIYIDFCHFEDLGSRILGEFVVRAMLESWPKE